MRLEHLEGPRQTLKKNVFPHREIDKIQILAIAPEGTRKKVKKWKTGFYYIALKANLPILMVSFDYEKKQVKIHKKFFPTGNIKADFSQLEIMVRGVLARDKI